MTNPPQVISGGSLNSDEMHFPPVLGKGLASSKPGLWDPGEGAPGGAQAAKPGLGAGCLDLVAGPDVVTMLKQVGFNLGGGRDVAGAVIPYSQGLAGDLTRSCCGVPTAESPERVFYQYSFNAIPIFSFCFGEGRLLEQVPCSSTPLSSPAPRICIHNPPVLVILKGKVYFDTCAMSHPPFSLFPSWLS